MPCPYCAAPMTGRRRLHCGEDVCRKTYNAERMRRFYRDFREREGVSYPLARYGDRRRASNNRWYAQTGQTERCRRNALARKALRRGATVERFTDREVFDRDGWTCGICALVVDRSLAWPHPRSRSLDHVVPLSEGGDHSRANTRLAHLDCNVRRNNRGGGEQLRIVG